MSGTMPIAEPVSSRSVRTRPRLVFMVRPRAGLTTSPAGFEASFKPFGAALEQLTARTGARIRPLFGAEENRLRVEATAPAGLPVRAGSPDLSLYYTIDAEPNSYEEIVERLLQMDDMVQAAYIKPPLELPALNAMLPAPAAGPPKTPNFTKRQLYLDSAPTGVDARFAWTLKGGNGADVRIVDIEGAWRFSHEDLAQNKGGVAGGTPPDDSVWRNHGTAVLGEFGGDDNAFGVTGICPQAEVSAVSIFPDEDSAPAIRLAAMRLRAGDILLVELHRAGPRYNMQPRNDQAGYIPIEWWQDDFDAIRFAIGRGIVVVEAGGNGAENLDDAIYDAPGKGFPPNWKNPFKRGARDSGAILVGAGAPPENTHNRSWGPDRSRLDFSNYGQSIDAQGWGREVTTCGYGDLQGGINEDHWYTDEFAGTSSASPIVVGAVGCLQGILRARGKSALTPAQVRDLLRSTGSPQQDAPGSPSTERIGNRPDLKQAIAEISRTTIAPKSPGKPMGAPSKTKKKPPTVRAKKKR
jgi:hypothetical protein